MLNPTRRNRHYTNNGIEYTCSSHDQEVLAFLASVTNDNKKQKQNQNDYL
jgi:hypothetical protein